MYFLESETDHQYRTTPVIDIMTKGPMCVTSDTSATEALNLMVSKGFRHLVKSLLERVILI